jgi:uncharacterized membrane-anchored protein YhcB (DUF1043 family)
MITMSVARIAETLQRDFRTAASQLRQTGKRFKTSSQHYAEAADLLDRWAASVTDVRPDLLVIYHELMAETEDRDRHAELLRQLAFKGAAKTASEYVSAYISDRTGGGRGAR